MIQKYCVLCHLQLGLCYTEYSKLIFLIVCPYCFQVGRTFGQKEKRKALFTSRFTSHFSLFLLWWPSTMEFEKKVFFFQISFTLFSGFGMKRRVAGKCIISTDKTDWWQTHSSSLFLTNTFRLTINSHTPHTNTNEPHEPELFRSHIQNNKSHGIAVAQDKQYQLNHNYIVCNNNNNKLIEYHHEFIIKPTRIVNNERKELLLISDSEMIKYENSAKWISIVCVIAFV